MFSILKRLFSHDPAQNIAIPEKKRPKATAHEIPDNLSISKTGIFEVEHTDDSVQWKRAQSKKTASGERDATLLDLEVQELILRLHKGDPTRFDIVKAAEIKRLWASSKTITVRDVVEVLKDAGRGFGERTVQNYFSVFNQNYTV